jgi:hypothetical protein
LGEHQDFIADTDRFFNHAFDEQRELGAGGDVEGLVLISVPATISYRAKKR